MNLRKDQEFIESNIRQITQHGPFNLTIKCKSSADAEKIEKDMLEKYKTKIEMSPPKEYPPMLKITNMAIEVVDKDSIVETIKKANYWSSELVFEVIDVYSIASRNGTYKNAILKCDIPTQTAFLERQKIIFGLTTCKVHEHVNSIQCKKCQRHGHFQWNCTFTVQCKRCSEAHVIEECTVSDSKAKCANCVRDNTKGAKYNDRHRSTDHRCPSRAARLDILKGQFMSKN